MCEFVLNQVEKLEAIVNVDEEARRGMGLPVPTLDQLKLMSSLRQFSEREKLYIMQRLLDPPPKPEKPAPPPPAEPKEKNPLEASKKKKSAKKKAARAVAAAKAAVQAITTRMRLARAPGLRLNYPR